MRPQTKKKSKPEVILDRNTRNKKKCVTTVYGLDGFGIKLSDAAKLFAKKYAGGAAVTKTPTDKEQIDVQVTFDFSLSFLPAD
jgi:density-regulated protein DRP1